MGQGTKEKDKHKVAKRNGVAENIIKCRICHKAIEYERFLKCDLCTDPICVSCTLLTEEVYDYLEEQGIEIPFLCSLCRKEMPKIREVLQIKEKHNSLQETVDDLSTKIENIEKMKIEERMSKLEKVIEEKKIDDESFPRLEVINSQTEKLNEMFKTQKTMDEKLNQQFEERIEEKRIEIREQNLIFYGIPEQTENYKEQLKEDYRAIKELYSGRVGIAQDDIANLARLGTKKENQIRPIRITFTSSEKRLKILRNNKDLVLYDESFPTCSANFCQIEDNHLHIYVSPDKTKQQRDLEKKLRDEVKERKSKGENDITIRNYKIVKTTRTQSRWVEIIKDGF